MSGMQQLREEKYRYTIETQGLLYTSKHNRRAAVVEDRSWSEDDSDHEDVPRKWNSPFAQRMETELARVLQEGYRDGLTDVTLERLLAGSVQPGSNIAGYDVAKDYIKQVFGQLYGPEDAQGNSNVDPGPGCNTNLPLEPANKHAVQNRGYSSTESSSCATLSGPGPSLPRPTPQTAPGAPPAVSGLMAPPWTGAITRSSAGGTSRAGDDDLERPRPRPHHGRIRDQLDLLQNADQLAAIISVATTAATTAAAAAMKQTMQTPPTLPPGAYARMHAAGQPVFSLPGSAGGQAPREALQSAPQPLQERDQNAAHAAAWSLGAESSDSRLEPQERPGTLVSPHQRSMPMVLSWRDRATAAGLTDPALPPGAPPVEQSQLRGDGPARLPGSAGALGGDAQVRRQRLRWSQRRVVPLGPSPGWELAGGGEAADSAGQEGGAKSTIVAVRSNMRVVRLGSPRVTARTPTPLKPSPPEELRSGGKQKVLVRPRIEGGGPDGAEPSGSSGEEDAAASGGRWKVAEAPERSVTSTGAEGAARKGSSTSAPVVRQVYHPHRSEKGDPTWLGPGNDDSTIHEQVMDRVPLYGRQDLPAEGLYVAGGESVFSRAVVSVGQQAAGLMQARQHAAEPAPERVPPPLPRRAPLPSDVQDAFRNALSYISDPDGAHQPKPLSWVAMADMEERKEAQREAEELLGGAFDYTAMRRELERAKRASRLVQRTAAAGAVAAVAGAEAVAALRARGVTPLSGGVGRVRSAAGSSASAAHNSRGDFRGVLPPIHSVWDVDEAWLDMDEFTKAVEADVQYRVAAAADRRDAAGPKHGKAAGGVDPAHQLGRAPVGARQSTGRATSSATTAAPAPGADQQAADRRVRAGKRAASPESRSAAPPLTATANVTRTTTSPSPPQVVRKTQPSAVAPVHVAFGRRVDAPPNAGDGAVGRVRSSSPTRAGRGSISRSGGRPRRARGVPRESAGAAATATSPSASSSDAVQQVLSALASALLFDGDGDGDGSGDVGGGGGGDDDDLHARPPGLEGGTLPGGSDLPRSQPGLIPHPSTRESDAQSTPEPNPYDTLNIAALALGSELKVTRSRSRMEGQVARAPIGVISSPLPAQRQQRPSPPSPVSERLIGASDLLPAAPASGPDSCRGPPPTSTATAPVTVSAEAAAASPHSIQGAAVVTPPTGRAWLLPAAGTSSGRSFSAIAARIRPRFQCVVDTAHPPITRLPAWATAAAMATGAPAAYVAALGTAPEGLGYDTPTRRHLAAPPVTAGISFATPSPTMGGSRPGSERTAQKQPSASTLAAQTGDNDDTALAATKTSYELFSQQCQQQKQQQVQLMAVTALSDPHNTTHVLPLPAAESVAGTPVTRSRTVNPGQQWEKTVFQAVEDEVVGRLAAIQLAGQGQGAEVRPEDLPGMVLPLVDAELSRRLVRDVVREHLCSLLASQWGRGGKDAAAAQISHEEALGPTLEEIVAALAAAPVLPPPRVVPQWQPQEQGEGAAALSAAAHDPCLEPGSYVQLGGQPPNLGQWQVAEGGSERPEVLGVAASTVHRDTGQPLEGSANGAEAVCLEQPATGLVDDVVDLNMAISGAEGRVDEPSVGGDVAPPVAGMNSYFTRGGATDTRQLWQPVYSNRRVQQQQLSRSSQTTAVTQQLPDTAAAAAISTAAAISAAAPAPTTATAAVSAHILGQAVPQQPKPVQAHGVVEARAVQAHGAETRGTQAVGVQERGLQASGVMDSASQADAPPPHYLLQAALAAGLSYGTGPGLPFAAGATGPHTGTLGPDIAALVLPRPFYLVPADNSSQLLTSLGLYGAAPGFTFMPYAAGGDISRPPLHLPGLSKLRDSSDVDSSRDSTGHQLSGPGTRARAAALDALRLASHDNVDDGLLQRSYTPLELASLMARPVRLDTRLSPSELSERQPHEASMKPPPHREAARPPSPAAARTDLLQALGSEPGASVSGSGESGEGSQVRGMDADSAPGRQSGGTTRTSSSRYLTTEMGPPSSRRAYEPRDDDPLPLLLETADDAVGAAVPRPSSEPFRSISTLAPPGDGGSAGLGSGQGIPSPSAASGVPSPALLSVSGSSTGTLHVLSVSGVHTPVAAQAPLVQAGLPTPAVADDELVADEDREEENPIQVRRYVNFASLQDEPTDIIVSAAAVSRDATGQSGSTPSWLSASFNAREVAGPPGSVPASQPASERFAGSPGDDDEQGARESSGYGREGGSDSGGDEEVLDFALSDDELLDEAEVSRVLAEEDVQDEELWEMERQVVVLSDSNSEELADLPASPSPEGTAKSDPTDDPVSPNGRRGSEGARSGSEDEDATEAAGNQATTPPLRSCGGGDGSNSSSSSGAAWNERISTWPSETQLRTATVAASSSTAAGPLPLGSSATDGGIPVADSVRRNNSGSGYGKDTGLGGSAVLSGPGSCSVSHNTSDSHGTAREASSSSLESTHLVIESDRQRSSGARGGERGSGGSNGGGSDGSGRKGVEEEKNGAALRTSLERLSFAGMAPLGCLQSGTRGGGGGLVRATAASAPLTSQHHNLHKNLQPGADGAAAVSRPVLAPLQLSSLSRASLASDIGGAAQPPDSPSKPPSLASYQGPTRPLWRPPSSQQPLDPLLSSSETLMASSEASEPTLDPLSRTLLEDQRRNRAAGPGGGLAASTLQRTRAHEISDSIESSFSTIDNMDSAPPTTSFPPQPPVVAGFTLPRQLACMTATAGATGPSAPLSTLGALDSELGGETATDSDDDGPGAARNMQRAGRRMQRAAAGADTSDFRGAPPVAGRGTTRREGAVFRLRQYGARRRKLLQQIGGKDSLLVSSTTSLSTDSSTVSDSDDRNGDCGSTLLRRGLTAATRGR